MFIKNDDLQMVEKICNKYFNKYSTMKGDLLQEGYLALCECYVEGYNNNENAFNRYKYLRVKGAMYDYIRREMNYRKYFNESMDEVDDYGNTLHDYIGVQDVQSTITDEFIEYLRVHNPLVVDTAILLLNDIKQDDISKMLGKGHATIERHVKLIKEVYKLYVEGDKDGK